MTDAELLAYELREAPASWRRWSVYRDGEWYEVARAGADVALPEPNVVAPAPSRGSPDHAGHHLGKGTVWAPKAPKKEKADERRPIRQGPVRGKRGTQGEGQGGFSFR